MTGDQLELRLSDVSGEHGGVPLVLGHSLGTSAALWNDALPFLQERLPVLVWELPGHGDARPARRSYRVQDATDAVIAGLAARGIDRFHYAGVSISGCVGLDLCLRYPESVATVTVISTGARVDDPPLMRERAVVARTDGMRGFVDVLRPRWFASTTPSRTAERVLEILARTDPDSYAFAAEALADFDVWDLVPGIQTPLLAVGGKEDRSVPVERSFELAARVRFGSGLSIPGAAHSVVAEQPEAVSSAIVEFAESNGGGGVQPFRRRTSAEGEWSA